MSNSAEQEVLTTEIKVTETETRQPKTEVLENNSLIKYENEDTEPPSNDDPFTSMSRNELIELCRSSSTYISNLESKLANCEGKSDYTK